jgi:hypothetical protein
MVPAAPTGQTRVDSALVSGEKAIRAGCLIFGLYLVAVSLSIVVAPREFFDSVGGFGPYNSHYLLDVAAFEGAVGVGLLIAFRRPAFRFPMLALATLHFGFHSLAHLVDIRDSNESWVGYFDFFSLAAATAILAWLTAAAARRSPTATAGAVREPRRH